MQNIRLTIQYDGTRYLGWQRPAKDGFEKTVSYRLHSVLRKMTGEDITLHVGAKTEPGVHALSQTVSFQTASAFRPDQFLTGLNKYLPQDISVLDAAPAPERFRADLNAISRTYEYRVSTAPVYDLFTAPYTAHLPFSLDRNAIQEAAVLLIGRHDFLNFSGVRPKKKEKNSGSRQTEKEIFHIHFSEETALPSLPIPDGNRSADAQGRLFTITLTADDFLFRMPSLIVGALLETGTGRRTPGSLLDLLEGREKAASLCAPEGLLLKSVNYN